MPRFHFPVPETQRSMSRPIIMEVVRQMLPIWGFPSSEKETRITILGENESIPATHSSLQEEPIINRLYNDNNVAIEVSEIYAQHVGPYEPLNRQNMPPIFWDKELEVWMAPQIREREVVINVTLKFRDRVRANEAIQVIQSRLQAYGNVHQHVVDYHYPIPVECMGRLIDLHKHRESKYPTGESLPNWLRRCFDTRMDIIRNMADKGHMFVIDEKQIGIQGWHEFDANSIPLPEQQTEATMFQVTFSYKFTYMRPEHVLIQYPISVYNQEIPAHLIDKRWVPSVESYFRFRDSTFQAIMAFKQDAIIPRTYYLKCGVPIPFYDDWMQYTVPRNQWQIFRLLLSSDDNDGTQVLNLGKLGEWQLNPLALQYIASDPMSIFRPFDNLFYFSLYRNDQLIDQTMLEMDSDLNITFPHGMDYKGIWHCTLNMVSDPTYLSAPALARALKNGALIQYYINLLKPGLGNRFTIIKDGSIPLANFRMVIKDQGFASNLDVGLTPRQVYSTVIVRRGPNIGKISDAQIAKDRNDGRISTIIAESGNPIGDPSNANNGTNAGTNNPAATGEYTEYSRSDI